MRFRASAFAVFSFALLGASAAQACSCIRYPGTDAERVQAQAAAYDHIFTAEVEKARFIENQDVLLDLRVTENLKGEAPERLEVLTPGPRNSCGGELARLPERSAPADGGPLARITVFTDLDEAGRGFYSFCAAVGMHAPNAAYEAFFEELRAAR